MRNIVVSILAVAFDVGIAIAAPVNAIKSVSVDRQSLNVAARETVTVTIDFARYGRASVVIVDRDGYPVRSLARDLSVSGPVSLGWDGRDNAGQFVADEAYSFKIDWRGTEGMASYFPANTPAPVSAIAPRSYTRRTATLTYVLPRPSRVHVQAGTANVDSKTKLTSGAVMKTVVNREPRIGGKIAEHWTGFDESGLIFVPDLPDFVVAIAASPLPENSIITFGNSERRFVDAIGDRKESSLFARNEHAEHHAGLATQDDVSPALVIEPLNAIWSATAHAWIADGRRSLRLRLAASGPTAAAFLTHPATVEVFVDGKRIGEPSPKHGDIVEVPLDTSRGIRRVCVNWNSEWGPVAANTVQVLVREQAPKIGTAR